MSGIKVKGNAAGTGNITIEAPNTNTDRTITLPDETGTIVTDVTAVEKDANGNVGIGITPEANWRSSWTALQVGGMGSITGDTAESAGNQFTLLNNAYIDGAGWKYKMTDEASMYQQVDGQHQWRVASSGTADTAISWTTAMEIHNDGDTEFGSFSSSGASVGLIISAVSHASTPDVQMSTTSTASKSMIQFFNPNGQVGKIYTNGSSTVYQTSSDYRLKENVVPMSSSIDRLKELNPVRFNFIADATTTVDGFLAHEAKAVVPEAVGGEKDAMKTEDIFDEEGNVTGTREVIDPQGIDQSKLVPLLTSALQEAVAKIEALETRVTALEGGTV